MIIKMKKLSVLLYHGQKEKFLSEIQSLGNVHIIEAPEKDTSGLQETETLVKRANQFIKAVGPQTGTPLAVKDAIINDQALVAMERFEKLEAENAAIDQSLQRCAIDDALLQPWGDIDPAQLRELAARGIQIRLFKAKTKAFDAIDKNTNIIEMASRMQDVVHFAVITSDSVSLEFDAEEQRLPDRTIAQICEETTCLREQKQTNEKLLQEIYLSIKAVRLFGAEQKTRNRFLSAQLDFNEQVDGKVLLLRGYFPARQQRQVEAVLQKYVAWYTIDNPTTSDDVPVKLSNGAFSRLFEPIMKMYMLPSYWELDPTPFFAPFFAFFVGLCLGDVGYGALILIGSIIAYRKTRVAMRPFSGMGIVLGSMIIFAGFLLNSFFGLTIFSGKGIAEGTALLKVNLLLLSPPPLAAVETVNGTLFPALSFSLLIAIFQLSFAMILQAVNKFRLGGIVPSISPIAMLLLFQGGLVCMTHTNFAELNMSGWVIASWRVGAIWDSIPLTVGVVLMFLGLALYFSVGHDDDKIIGRFGWRLFDFYNFVAGMLGNVLSYVRLFALGLCGGSLAFTINSIAIGFITKNGETDWLSPMAIFTVLLLVGGHAFNFTLSLIGAFVHPLRLTFVEFLGTLQFSGGGKPYTPFEKVKVE